MARIITLNLLLNIFIILIMYPEIEGFWVPLRPRLPTPRPRPHLRPIPLPKPIPKPYVPLPNKPIPTGPVTPLCRNQFALVNRACAWIPNTPVPSPVPPIPTPTPPGPDIPTPIPDPDVPIPDPDVPIPDPDVPTPDPDVPSPTPAPPPTEGGEIIHGHHGHHGHHHAGGHHHHHHHHHHHGTSAEEECCRWLKEVDSVCVCGVLAHLPTFLSKPTHNYTVMVGGTCAVTFGCVPRVLLA